MERLMERGDYHCHCHFERGMPTDDLLLALATTVSARYGTACSLLLRFKMYAADTTRAPRRPTTLQCLLFPTFHCSSTSFASIHDQSTNHKSIKRGCLYQVGRERESVHTHIIVFYADRRTTLWVSGSSFVGRGLSQLGLTPVRPAP